MLLIFANICGLISVLSFICSAGAKTEKSMLKLQIVDTSFTVLSCGLLFGIGGVISGSIGLIRNILIYKNIKPFWLPIVINGLLFSMGMFNMFIIEHSVIAIIPVVATMIYTTALFMDISYKQLKVALFINIVLWLIYDFIMGNYTGGIGNTLAMINVIRSYICMSKSTVDVTSTI